MPAITPNAPGHAGLGPLDSRFVRTAELPWTSAVFPGVKFKTLLLDRESGLLTVLLHMEAGAKLPDHEHVLIEQTYVLSGRLKDADGEVGPGDFVWRPAGSRHEAWTPVESLMLAVFQVPNKFFREDGSITDFLGADWDRTWGRTAAQPAQA
jgi:anti-sigma factor ChrR (cupin superfamily)